jgi:hypothetical protein
MKANSLAPKCSWQYAEFSGYVNMMADKTCMGRMSCKFVLQCSDWVSVKRDFYVTSSKHNINSVQLFT